MKRDGQVCPICYRKIAIRGHDSWLANAFISGKPLKTINTACVQSQNGESGLSCYKLGYERLSRQTSEKTLEERSNWEDRDDC